MEIPVIDRISDFEAGIASLQSQSIISQFISFSGFPNISQAYKWGPLILALLASFTTIINQIKFLIIRFQSHHFLPNPPYDVVSDYDSDSDVSSSGSSSPSDDEEDENDQNNVSDEDDDGGDSGFYIDDQWQNRNFRLRRRRSSSSRSIGDLFSLSELASGTTSVVKLWDNLGLGFGLNLKNDVVSSSESNVISLYDANEEQNVYSIFAGKSEAPVVSPSRAVVVTGEANLSGNLLRVWDSRVGCRIPQILAEWRPRLGRIVGVAGGAEKLYVRDDVTGGLTVGDMRMAGSPLVDVTESDVDTWWDADAVIVKED